MINGQGQEGSNQHLQLPIHTYTQTLYFFIYLNSIAGSKPMKYNDN